MILEMMAVSLAALVGLGIVTFAALRAWHGWLAFRRWEVERGGLDAGSRIELAALRERLRRLEAIAAGVDL